MGYDFVHPDAILPGMRGFVMANNFLDRQRNMHRTQRVQKYISMYHLDVGNPGNFDNEEEIPVVQNPRLVIPERIWPFYQVKSKAGANDGGHFWCDDYEIMRFLRHPEKFMPVLQKCPCVFSLDLSTYQEFSLPLVRWNVYLNRVGTQELQKNGVNAVPVLQWRDSKSFPICFLGIPKGCTIAFSTVGVMANKVSTRMWKEGVCEALRQIEPEFVFIYGDPIDFNFGSIGVCYLQNEAIRRCRKNGR